MKNNSLNDLHFIKCGPVPVLRNWRELKTSELTRAERNMRFCERFIKIADSDGSVKPFKLEDFQEYFFYAVFDNPHGTRKAIFSVARKNGKSTLIAAILICFLVGPEALLNAQIVSGAMSREQAAIIFKQAHQMMMLSEDLQVIVKPIESKKMLLGLPLSTEYKALASDGSTAVGLDPQLILCDETGQVVGETSDFIQALTTSQGARQNPLIIYLSTQAATDNDYLSREIDDAIMSQDPKIVCHVYECPADYEIDNPEGWKMANPGLGTFRSEEDLRNVIEEAKRMPSKESSVRNYYLNQRVSTNSPFVSRSVWEENGQKPAPLKGKAVYGGLDLSAVSDLTGLVVEDEEGNVECRAWLPEEGIIDKSKTDRVPYDRWAREGYITLTPGRSIRYSYVAQELRRIFDEYDVRQINFDRFNMKFLLPELERVGFKPEELERFVDFGQGYVSMSPALRSLETALLAKEIKHGMHPVLTMCMGNCVVEMDAAGNRKFTKKKSTGRIDLAVCLAMAESARSAHKKEEKNKEWSLYFI